MRARGGGGGGLFLSRFYSSKWLAFPALGDHRLTKTYAALYIRIIELKKVGPVLRYTLQTDASSLQSNDKTLITNMKATGHRTAHS